RHRPRVEGVILLEVPLLRRERVRRREGRRGRSSRQGRGRDERHTEAHQPTAISGSVVAGAYPWPGAKTTRYVEPASSGAAIVKVPSGLIAPLATVSHVWSR